MYKLPVLPFHYEELEPYIDTHTIGLHYLKHEKTYLDNLNKLLQKNGYDYKYSMEELIYHIDEFEDKNDILFNLGGVLNHILYFNSIGPIKNIATGKLLKKINEKYGSQEELWQKIKVTALKLKGSGYTFLVYKNEDIDIINLSNQETPLLYGMVPLFNIDLWEHAYYINYENDKSKYLDNIKEIADFTNASEIYEKIA